MKRVYAIIFIITIISIIISLVGTRRNKHPLSASLRNVMRVALICVISSMIQVLSENALICNIAYSFFFSGIDLLLLTTLNFTLNFVNYKPKKNYKIIFYFFIALDIIQLLLNPIFNHAFSVYPKEFPNEIYYHYTKLFFFSVHLTLSYVICTIILALLIWKIIRVHNFLKTKYIVFLVEFIVILILDSINLISKTELNFMMLGFCFGSIIIYFYAIKFVPNQLLNYTLARTALDMQDGLIVFDDDNVCIFSNMQAFSNLGIKPSDSDKIYTSVSNWCAVRNLSLKENFEYIWNSDNKENPKTIKIINKIYINNNKILGSSLITTDQTKETQQLKESIWREHHDKLTGLYNHSYFCQKLKELITKNSQTKYILVYADFTDFKLVNELLGRETGDKILIQVGEFFRQREDFNTGLYGRLGADKFGMCLPEFEYKEDVFEYYMNSLISTFSSTAIKITVHMGIYKINDINESAESMIDKAAMALSKIKHNASKTVCFYSEEMLKNAHFEKSIVASFQETLEQNRFHVYLQPQCTPEGKILGAEALLRWINKDDSILMPEEFIPVLEKTGYIIKADSFVWRESARILSEWKGTEFEDLYIAVNISGKDLLYTDIYEYFTNLVQEFNINPKKLKLEFTETVIVTQFEQINDTVKKLRDYGFYVEIDDFGSGYSSLNTLKNIDVDTLKFDMAFLRGNDTPKSRAIIQQMFSLANELKLNVVTEGVENEKQLNMLVGMSGKLFQGYYFSKPVSIDKFSELYKKHK